MRGKLRLRPMLRVFLLFLAVVMAGCQAQNKSSYSTMKPNEQPTGTNAPQVVKSDEEWRKELTPEQYRVLRHAGTEAPFGAAYDEFKKQGAGTYVCGACG